MQQWPLHDVDHKKKRQYIVTQTPWRSEKKDLSSPISKKKKQKEKEKEEQEKVKPILLTTEEVSVWQDEKESILFILGPTMDRLKNEIQYKHHKMEVPVCFIRFTRLGKLFLDETNKNFTFNPPHWSVLDVFSQMLYCQGQLIATSTCPVPFYLKNKPTDQVIFFDRSQCCCIQNLNQSHFYIPVYFQSCYFIYCIVIALNDLIQWQWLESQWNPHYKDQLSLTKMFIQFMQINHGKKDQEPTLRLPGQFFFRLPDKYFVIPKMSSLIRE